MIKFFLIVVIFALIGLVAKTISNWYDLPGPSGLWFFMLGVIYVFIYEIIDDALDEMIK